MTWNASELRRHLKAKPDMEKNLKHALSEQLMKSLLKQREARHETKEQRYNKVLLQGAMTKHRSVSVERMDMMNNNKAE
jgi:hypothetical protein